VTRITAPNCQKKISRVATEFDSTADTNPQTAKILMVAAKPLGNSEKLVPTGVTPESASSSVM